MTATRVPFTWLYMFVTTDNFVGHLANHATGAGYPAVRPDDFERAALPVPPRILLDQFHETAEPKFRLICKLDQQNQKLSQARDLLLPRLMNGRLRSDAGCRHQYGKVRALAVTPINSEDWLVQATFAEHLEQVLGGRASMPGTKRPSGRTAP